ncbi:MAG TPA: ABC transporter permease, partial [Pyrinomonadaceae bacterium]
MNLAGLVRRNLTYYWRTNLAVVFGVGVAVAVLAGALLVGDSVRASLRGLFLERLGRTEAVVTSAGFFREQLAADVRGHSRFAAGGFEAACPLVALVGAVAHEESGRRGAGLQVYGVDERFWQFHGREGAASRAPRGSEVLLSESLAAELGAKAGDTLLLRIEKPSEIPVESVHGRKEDLGRTLRLTVREALPPAALGEFSVRPQQSAVRAVFVPLGLLQKELKQEGKVNTLLVSAKAADENQAGRTDAAALENILRESFALEDLGITVRALDERRGLALESDSALVNDHLAEAARAAAEKSGMRAAPVLSYLANTISANGREVP